MSTKRLKSSVDEAHFFMKKRKVKDEDSVSLHSFAGGALDKDGEVKRKRGLAKVTSFASILSSPIRPIRKASNALQRSISGVWASPSQERIHPPTPSKTRKPLTLDSSIVSETFSGEISPPSTPSGKRRLSLVSLRRMSGVSLLSLAPSTTPYKLAPPSTPSRRALRLWSHTVSAELLAQLDSREIKRQEAIFELYQGEVDLVDDLRMIMHTYRDSLLNLGILTQADASTIFGDLEQLIVIHQELVNDLKDTRDSNEVFCSVGYCLSNWVPQLKAYYPYCSNQIKARNLLEEKKMKDVKFADFLQRCLDSPFSRRLDLWSFLDVPRGRLVKYPLLIKQIAKYSSEIDIDLINACLKELGAILERANYVTGLARCNAAKECLTFSADAEHKPEGLKRLNAATNLVCEGALRNVNGVKLQCFLFDTCLVVSRPLSQPKELVSTRVQYLVQSAPVPIEEVSVSTMGEREFRNGNFLTGATNVKYLFSVESLSQTLIFSTTNESNRKLWIQSLSRLAEAARKLLPKPEVEPAEEMTKPKLKASLISWKRLNKQNLRREAKSAPQLRQGADKENIERTRKRTSSRTSSDTPTFRVKRNQKSVEEKSNLRTMCTRSMTNILIP